MEYESYWSILLAEMYNLQELYSEYGRAELVTAWFLSVVGINRESFVTSGKASARACTLI